MIKKEIKTEWQNQDGENFGGFEVFTLILIIIMLPLLILWIWSNDKFYKIMLTVFITIFWLIIYHKEFPKRKIYLIDK